MNEIRSHRANINDQPTIRIFSMKEENSPEVVSRYRITVNDLENLDIQFQHGPVPNGVTNEALIAVIIHRLTAFQDGPFSCPENAKALERLHGAMHYLHARTERPR